MKNAIIRQVDRRGKNGACELTGTKCRHEFFTYDSIFHVRA
jgi:hypothetical protein